MGKKLIAIDMDGTLIGAKGISAADKEAIKAALSEGHIVAIISGRSFESVKEILDEEGLGHLPVSGSNGAITVVDGQEIRRVTMPPKLVSEVTGYFEAQGFPFLVYTSGGVFSKKDFLTLAEQAFDSSPGLKGSPFESYAMMVDYIQNHGVRIYDDLADLDKAGCDILKVFVFLPDGKKRDGCHEALQLIPGARITSSFGDNFSISGAEGHKGSGLQALADHFGIPLSSTAAIGDNHNDLGMLELAGMSIAMSNGDPEIKAYCHKTTLSNLESGVAFAIHSFIL